MFTIYIRATSLLFLTCSETEIETTMAPSKEFKELKEYLEGKFADTRQQISVLTESLDSTTAALQHNLDILEHDVHELKEDRDEMRSTIKACERRVSQLNEQVTAMEIRSRRQNLKFTDISEESNKSAEVCLSNFIKENLKIDMNSIKITSAFRVGKMSYPTTPSTRSKAKQRPRPIIASFSDLNQVKLIKQAAYSRPKGSKGGVEPDLPKQIVEARQAAYIKFIKPAKQAGKKIKWIKDSLYIDGRLVDRDVIVNLTRTLQKEKSRDADTARPSNTPGQAGTEPELTQSQSRDNSDASSK